MILIPALDILDGQAIRLRGGDPNDVSWKGEDPLTEARRWWERGAERLHVVDLSRVLNRTTNPSLVREVLKEARRPVQVGGGLRTDTHLREVLDARDDSCAIVATRAWREPDWLDHISTEWPGRIIVALELKQGRVAVRGWTRRLTLGLDEGLFRLAGLELGGVLLTDVDREGRLGGPNVDIISRAAEELSVPLIASGGVSTVEHVRALRDARAWGCVVGTALYTGELDFQKAMEAAR